MHDMRDTEPSARAGDIPLVVNRKQLPGDPRFHALLEQIGQLHAKKQADYGAAGDPFANVRASEDFGVPGWVGCAVRMNDKMRRLMTASKKGKEALENESLRDSFLDLAVYSLIGIILLEEEEDVELPPAPLHTVPPHYDPNNPPHGTPGHRNCIYRS